jgi:hypothetical protein
MLQTGYKGFTTLSKGLPYNGGFCKWYYADKAQLVAFPAIDPLTQYLSAEPLISGSWHGPVQVPNDQLGFEETPKRDSTGLYWQHKITGFHPGDNAASRINIENLHFYELVVIGKMRAGGMYLLIGTPEHGLQFDAAYSSDGKKSAGNNFTLTANLLNKAFVLPSFNGTNIILPPGSIETGGTPLPDDDMREPELFPFDAVQTQVSIDWNAARKQRFGSFPLIEVWYTEGNQMRLSTSPAIAIDALPPNTTLFTITINTPGPGMIVIK